MKQPILSAAFALAVLGAWAPAAHADLTPLGQIPTRMQLCQDELQGADGKKPPAGKMRECLARRAEADSTIASQCDQDVAAAQPKAADPALAKRTYMARAMRVPYAQLPRGKRGAAALAKSKNRAVARAAPKPKPKAKPSAPADNGNGSPAPSAPPPMPDAGDAPRAH